MLTWEGISGFKQKSVIEFTNAAKIQFLERFLQQSVEEKFMLSLSLKAIVTPWLNESKTAGKYISQWGGQQRRVLAIQGKTTGSKPRTFFSYEWALWPLASSRCTCVSPPTPRQNTPASGRVVASPTRLVSYERAKTRETKQNRSSFSSPRQSSCPHQAGRHSIMRDNPSFTVLAL
jgi:hypothetical protein